MSSPSSGADHGAAPRRVIVVGAGMVGLSTAWFLQEYGVDVTVVDRVGVAAGSSWGNAGWLSPVMAIPLPEPSVLRYGLRALLDRNASLAVPPTLNVDLWRFLTRFAAHCTLPQWRRAMSGYLDVNRESLATFDQLNANGVASPTISAPILACFTRPEQATPLRHEFVLIAEAGQPVQVSDVDVTLARTLAPQIGQRIRLVLRIDGQRYFDPGAFVNSLADSVVARGATLRTDLTVRSLRHELGAVTVEGDGGSEQADAVVVATGAWLNELARPLGVKVRVQAGRGYSFSLATDEAVPGPIYFPAARVACTPYHGGLRVGGTMEFRSPDAPIVASRVDALVRSVKPLLRGVDWNAVSDVWVGPRPVTADGLPLVGATNVPGVFVAGGHGMWGITLGPITGKLLAEQIVTGVAPDALSAFAPLR
jgi:D-amino-acid dehydrogenase